MITTSYVKLSQISAVTSTGRRNTIKFTKAKGVLQMEYRALTYYTEKQKSLMWNRWKKSYSLHQIASLFDR